MTVGRFGLRSKAICCSPIHSGILKVVGTKRAKFGPNPVSAMRHYSRVKLILLQHRQLLRVLHRLRLSLLHLPVVYRVQVSSSQAGLMRSCVYIFWFQMVERFNTWPLLLFLILLLFLLPSSLLALLGLALQGRLSPGL